MYKSRGFSYKQCEVDPSDPRGACLDCKARGREDTCDKVPGLSIHRRPSHSSAETNGGYEQLRNDVDRLKLSFDDFRSAVTTSIDSIHSILLRGANPPNITPTSSFIHDV